MSTRTKIVLSALVVLDVLAGIGVGTFATFTAEAKNPGNLFADGTLVLSNKVGSGTACLSTGGGTTDTNANSCSPLFNLSTRKPGDSGAATLTIKNEGTISASVLKVFTTACTNSNAVGERFHGTGLPCSAIDLTIQEYSNPGFSMPRSCWYGGGTATTCAFDNTKTLAAFQSTHNSPSNGLSTGSGLVAGAARYIKVSVQLPSTADDSYQGRQATADFTWYAAQ